MAMDKRKEAAIPACISKNYSFVIDMLIFHGISLH
jgi:hypothetical protein